MIEVVKDTFSGKYVGMVNGKAVFSAATKYYVQQKLKSIAALHSAEPKIDEFAINKRFDFVAKMVNMVATKKIASVIISGEGGLGKTFTAIKSLEAAGLKNITDLADFQIGEKLNLSKSYRVIKGYSTPKGLYRTLVEGSGMTLVFDDCDSVLKDPVALNLIKSALDSFGDRYISWMADMRDDDLPKTFKFTGNIIFITNISLQKLDQAVRTRAMCVDLSMSEAQKLERMRVIVKSDEFLPTVQEESKLKALEYLESLVGKIPNLSLRTLITVAKIADSGDSDWKDLAKYVVNQGQ